MWLSPQQVDLMYLWPRGRAARLARAGELPGYRMPDGSIRFKSDEIEGLNDPMARNTPIAEINDSHLHGDNLITPEEGDAVMAKRKKQKKDPMREWDDDDEDLDDEEFEDDEPDDDDLDEEDDDLDDDEDEDE